jgi:hypothetical protein
MTLIKPALFALLAVNAVVYATAGRAAEGLDALAWFALLVLFEMETRWPRWTHITRNAAALDLLRLAAAAGIAIAALAYLREGEWLDAANAWLWIGVVAVLELEVRLPSLVTRNRTTINVISYMLFGALAAVALAWLAQGAWLDGYDAVLWIAAFALIETDLLRRAPQSSTVKL